ncbi:MAG: hypothetical protein JWP27_1354 [Flaviaesturariibacter sp.]|nr:hypothetical protein [Flaviaesturariibacter sp.]
MEEKPDPHFTILWTWVLVGFVLGILGLIPALFVPLNRRDKVHSTLLGAGVSLAVNLAILYFRFR